jgi:hypothetical protein
VILRDIGFVQVGLFSTAKIFAAVISLMLQPLGLQKTLNIFLNNSLFNCQKLPIFCPYNLLIIVHFLGGLLAIFGG